MRLLASAQDGGSTIAECLQAASRIIESDDNSWHREWKRLADASARRGEHAVIDGNPVTAASYWLRATNYHLASLLLLDAPDQRRRTSIGAMRTCARNYLRHGRPSGEIVSIPWLKDYSLQGYLLPPPGGRGRSPTVVCIGEPGHLKEEFLFKLAHHAGERGLALLALDLWGDRDDGDGLDEVVGRRELETVIPRALDYLSGRDDVDDLRMAVLADGWGSSFVARGVAAESRIAAAVCDGGIWDLHERAFVAGRLAGQGVDVVSDPLASRIARNIDCPLLITLGERGWLKADRVSEMVDQLKTNNRDITLKVFTPEETAAAQAHADNPTIANEFIFDWLVARLAVPRAIAA